MPETERGGEVLRGDAEMHRNPAFSFAFHALNGFANFGQVARVITAVLALTMRFQHTVSTIRILADERRHRER